MSNLTAGWKQATKETGACLLTFMVFGVALILPDAVSASEVKVSAYARYFAEDSSGDSVGALTQTASTGMVSKTAEVASLGSGGRAVATASLGVLESLAAGAASRGNINNGYASQGQSRADASWYDLVTIVGAGPSGTGSANVRFFVDAPSGSVTNSGTADVGGSFSGSAAADFGLRVNGVLFTFNTQAVLTHSDTDPRYTFTRVNGVDYSGGLDGYWDLAVPITFGQAFGINAVLTTSATALAGANSTVSS